MNKCTKKFDTSWKLNLRKENLIITNGCQVVTVYLNFYGEALGENISSWVWIENNASKHLNVRPFINFRSCEYSPLLLVIRND